MRRPDLKAPRYRYKFLDVGRSSEFFKDFRKQYPQYASYTDDQLSGYIYLTNETISNEIIESRDGIELPLNLGYIFIGMMKSIGDYVGVKTKRPNIAWKKSMELGIKVMHKNWDTDNHIGKIYYCNSNSTTGFQHRKIWEFKASRIFARRASASIQANWKRYVIIEPTDYISKLFDQYSKRFKMSKRTERNVVGYNDFEMEDN